MFDAKMDEKKKKNKGTHCMESTLSTDNHTQRPRGLNALCNSPTIPLASLQLALYSGGTE
jgi:hypothetical protein